MKLYNSLTKQIETLQSLQSGLVTVYTCGPTVYNHIHIGNLSSFIFADSLRRALLSDGYSVQHAMNFTDVDDKTIRRSQEQYGGMDPLEALLRLTSEYADLFIQDMVAVGNDVGAMAFIKATDSIEPMQQLISDLHSQGFAYIADDGVYFSIKAYQESGKQYGQLTDITVSSTSQARIQNDEYDKESAHDFALWKKHKAGEPAWDFELDGQNIAGRPGWHIECSAMSQLLLGQPFDIHTGGVDLRFPHHENELAQSTAGRNVPYATIFAHNEHLLIDGQKMSKSLDNFYTLEDILDKGYDPLAFRLLVLQAHYRKQAHFSWDNLQAAQNRLQGYRAMADQYWQPRAEHGLQAGELAKHLALIKDALLDDLDMPPALAALSALQAAIDNSGINTACQEAYGQAIEWLDEAFGLRFKSDDLSEELKQLIKQRELARTNNDWDGSDNLRDSLLAKRIAVRDTAYGPVWSRVWV